VEKAIYEKGNWLYIRGNNYRSLSEEEAQESLRSQIFTYLSNCQKGLVVIDEAQLLRKSEASVFQDFLDLSTYTYQNKYLHVGGSIFIFITDFGVEGRTENMTIEQIKTEVFAEALNKWDHKKQAGLANSIIPFDTIKNDGVNLMVDHLLEQLPDHTCFTDRKILPQLKMSTASRHNLHLLVNEQADQVRYRHMNYRGVTAIFEELVTAEVCKQVSDRIYTKTQILTVEIKITQEADIKVLVGLNKGKQDL